jgi:DNA mismatch repair protein MutS2
MKANALEALEFDQIVALVTELAVTSTGRDRLEAMTPLTDQERIIAAQRATTEGRRFLADHPGFPLRGPADLDAILGALGVDGRALEPLRLFGLAEYLVSIEQTRSVVLRVGPAFPILSSLVAGLASFKHEIADVRRTIEPFHYFNVNTAYRLNIRTPASFFARRLRP